MPVNREVPQVQLGRGQGVFRQKLLILFRVAVKSAWPTLLVAAVMRRDGDGAIWESTRQVRTRARDHAGVVICDRPRAGCGISAQRQQDLEPGPCLRAE